MHDYAGSHRRSRRGNYSMFLGFMLPVFLGFAALSVDTSWIRMSDSQAQDVADAVAHAALIELRRTGNTTDAEDVAEYVAGANRVGNGHAGIEELTFGTWERGGAFAETSFRPNAVSTRVGRYAGKGGVQLRFARIWDYDEVSVEGDAVAASRSMHVVLVMDVTGSFKNEIHLAADAAVAFLDILSDSHGKYDKIGMATFYYIYGHERTPLTLLDDEAAITVIRSDWQSIRHASRIKDDYPSPFDMGPRPHMPIEYDGEQGTDHHVGVAAARGMFQGESDPFAYRAQILLTDGQPVNLGTSTVRQWLFDNYAFEDNRWEYYQGPVPHSKTDIMSRAISESGVSWEDERIHQWVVSFRETNDFMRDMVHGDGVFYFTNDPNELRPIFEEIAYSLPLLIVE